MQQSATGIDQLSTAVSGNVPTTVGGSSVATATAAGIAALVWSKFPTYTRENVINKLTTTASLYPNKNKNFGWGKLNADAATNQVVVPLRHEGTKYSFKQMSELNKKVLVFQTG